MGHRATARKILKDIRANLGAEGFLRAYQKFGRTGEMPKSERLGEMVNDLSETVALMASLERDYPRPDEDDDWEQILLDARLDWPPQLTSRWYPLFFHEVQHALVKNDVRFKICPAGRRSGKTERAMRFLVMEALSFTDYPDGLFIAAAPTHDQAKEVFWEHLKAFVPSRFIVKISESKLWIRLINGARIMVAGLDKPQRIEGKPIDGIIIDEFGDTKEKLWGTNALPALNTIGREGWAWIIGVPRGARHYRELFEEARDGDDPEYAAYTWFSSEILSAKQIKAIRNKTDDLTWAAEWESSFETTMERIYYSFLKDLHSHPLTYNPALPLALCFDFGTTPGVALVVQEQTYEGPRDDVAKTFTAVLDEVHIPRGSTTEKVCEKLLIEKGYAAHPTIVRLYGDASGGAQKSSSVRGSDWDLVFAACKPHFGNRMIKKIRKANPAVVSRTASVNSRLKNPLGIHMLVDPSRCPHTVIDLQDVVPKEGSREIDKTTNKHLSHLCFTGSTLVDVGGEFERIDALPETGLVRTWDGSLAAYTGAGWKGEKSTVRLWMTCGYSIECTPDHMFLTTRGWVEARNLIGDVCLTWNAASNLSIPIASPEADALPGLTTRLALANAVASRTWSARPTQQRFVVIEEVGPADVFCMAVESGCFVGETGLVLSNSDALGYYCEREWSVGKFTVRTSAL